MTLSSDRTIPLEMTSKVRPISLPATCALALVVAACAGGGPPTSNAPPGATGSPAATADDGSDLPTASARARPGLRPGDVVQVEVWREPDLSGKFEVAEDGVVVFPLLGRRDVTGIPSDSLQRRLVREYSEYLDNPSVDVTPLRRISILGEVRKPGLYPVNATITLADALAMAGGTTPNADRDDVRLLRDGRVIRKNLDVDLALEGSPVRSGDRIWVGERSWISRNWQWVAGTVATALTFALFR